MSNSPMVVYTKISPNRTSPRQDTIKKITIHHMAGNLSVETCGNVFAPSSRQASSNYGIDSNGRVGMYVEEKDRSWCTCSRENDNQAITIEVADDGTAPNWHVSDKAIDTLVDLCVDICKRNNIPKLVFTGDKSGNVTLHKWFANTTCPGPYLESKIPEIVERVNAKLGVAQPAPAPAPAQSNVRTLKKGCKGDDVTQLQKNLNIVMKAGLVTDGSFGAKTDAAVREFQKAYGLEVDGKFGPASRKAMENALNKATVEKAKTSYPIGTVNARGGLNVRNAPNGTILNVLPLGTKVNIISESNGWIKIAEGQFVSATYITK